MHKLCVFCKDGNKQSSLFPSMHWAPWSSTTCYLSVVDEASSSEGSHDPVLMPTGRHAVLPTG